MQNFIALLKHRFMLEAKMSRINQQTLARELNLSQTTVSRSLANHPAINAETKALVLETAAKLGYSQPMRPVRSEEASDQTTVCGVLITMPKAFSGPSETFQEVLRGIAERSARLDTILDVVYHDPSDIAAKSLFRRIRSAKWKGVIQIYPIAEETAARIANRIASVSIIEKYPDLRIDSIDVDQSDAIQQNILHLHAHGHRRIGFFTWQYSVKAPWVLHRFGAYVEGLYRTGLTFDPDRVVNLAPAPAIDPEAAALRAAALIRDGVTAFVCAADHQAYRLINDLRGLGFSVPDDVSITGFDGVAPDPGQPQLTTVAVPYAELGRSATYQLLRRMEQPASPRRHIIVDGKFIPGETVSAPAR
jgi:DNA-binding LacI/PurR family transcriptional regulator